jgi:lipocalin
MQKTLILAAALAVLGMVNARTSNGACSAPALQADFDAIKYQGTWFQAAKDVYSPDENGNCAQTRFIVNSDGTLNLRNSQFDNATQTISNATLQNTCVGARCSLGLSFLPWWAARGDYRVMDTDYLNYALIYSCKNAFLRNTKRDLAWIVTRE